MSWYENKLQKRFRKSKHSGTNFYHSQRKVSCLVSSIPHNLHVSIMFYITPWTVFKRQRNENNIPLADNRKSHQYSFRKIIIFKNHKYSFPTGVAHWRKCSSYRALLFWLISWGRKKETVKQKKPKPSYSLNCLYGIEKRINNNKRIDKTIQAKFPHISLEKMNACEWVKKLF